MKLVVLISLLGVFCSSVFAEKNPFVNLSEKQLEALNNLDPELLPADLFQQRSGDSSHWCCRNEQPAKTYQVTRVTQEVIPVATKSKIGYTSCGLFGAGRCSIYAAVYKNTIGYYIATFDIPTQDACPDRHVLCCKSFISIGGNCLSLEQAFKHQKLIKLLKELGLLDS